MTDDRPDPINTPEQREQVVRWLINPAQYWGERCARAEAALAADRAAGIVRVDTWDEALVERLVARQVHADWCCTKGCVQDRQMHQEFSGSGRLVGEYPCPGTCTCEVDGITRAVLIALREETT